MIKKQIFSKRDSSENWAKAINFIPQKEEIIIYEDIFPCGIKIGDGKTKVNDLPFINEYKVRFNDNILIIGED